MARLALVAWLGLLLYLALLPDLPQPPVGRESITSSLAHFVTHLMLAALVYLAAGNRPTTPVKRVAIMALALGVSATWGLALEGVQSLLHERSAQVSDVLFDIGGAGAGSVLAVTLDSLKVSRGFLSVAGLGVTILLIITVGASGRIWDPSLPYIGDHWHASYQISICGRELPPLLGTPGGVHTHGRGQIHIHPISKTESGDNATLALFLSTSGGLLTRDSMILPSGETYANGDPCSGGQPGVLVVTVNGTRVEMPSSYVLGNRDRIWIGFQPARETSK